MASILEIFRRTFEVAGDETAQGESDSSASRGSADDAVQRAAGASGAADDAESESCAASSSGLSSTGAGGDEAASSTMANAGDDTSQSSVSCNDEQQDAQDSHCQTVYEVNIKCIDGSVTKMDIPDNLRGLSLKQKISDRLHVPVERQRLIFRGRVVQDEDILGEHITQSGQTIHLVQRPPSSVLPGSGSAQSSNSHGQPHGPTPQTATDNVPPPLVTFPGQSELSQILGSMLGAVNRAVEGGPIVHTVPLVRGPVPPAAPMTPTAGAASSVASPRDADAAPPPSAQGFLNLFTQGGATAQATSAPRSGLQNPWRQGWPSRECMMLSLLLGCLALVMPMLAWCIVQIEATFVVSSPPWHIWAFGFHLLGLVLGLPSLCLALRSRSPLRSFRTLVTPGGMTQHDQTGLTQFLAAMAVQPLNSPQIVFQQGNITATVQEEGFDLPGAMGADTAQGPAQSAGPMPPQREPMPPRAAGATLPQNADGSTEGLPWQELQGLGDRLDQLLHRPGRSGRLTAAGMPPLVFGAVPGGELQAFLASLHAATSQLSVGISDIQTALAVGDEPSPEQMRHLSLAFAAAARTFNSASLAVPGDLDIPVAASAEPSEQDAPISAEVD